MNWMSCHEDRMSTDLFAGAVEDIKPVIAKGSSDSAALDSFFFLLTAPMVIAFLTRQTAEVSDAFRL